MNNVRHVFREFCCIINLSLHFVILSKVEESIHRSFDYASLHSG